MPCLREHNPTIEWNNTRITFDRKGCMTWCLKGSWVAYTEPLQKGLEENLITRFAKVQAKHDHSANDKSVRVKQLSNEARLPVKGSARGAGDDLNPNEGSNICWRGQAIFGSGIAIGLSHNTYERIAPGSSLVVKHGIRTGSWGDWCQRHRWN